MRHFQWRQESVITTMQDHGETSLLAFLVRFWSLVAYRCSYTKEDQKHLFHLCKECKQRLREDMAIKTFLEVAPVRDNK